MARARSIADPEDVADSAYSVGLRWALGTALDYGLAIVESGETGEPPVPVDLLGQARLAARNGIALDTVLRRYFAGHSLFGIYLIEEASKDGLIGGAELQRLVATQASRFDRLLAMISEVHTRESEALAAAQGKCRREKVERLLTGEPIDAAELRYDLDGCHLGAVGVGPEAAGAIRELATRFDKRHLLVRCDAETVWAWLGGHDPIVPEEHERLLEAARGLLSTGTTIAFGEPGTGSRGWRLTHRQAKAILPLLRGTNVDVAGYAKLALLATVLQDEVMRTSLRELFLTPLETGRNEGAALRATLDAYFTAGGRVSSTAAALGVARRTVRNRLHTIEEKIGGTVEAYTAELRTALRLAEFDSGTISSPP